MMLKEEIEAIDNCEVAIADERSKKKEALWASFFL